MTGGGGGYGPVGNVIQGGGNSRQGAQKRWIEVAWYEQFAGVPITLNSLGVTVDGGLGGVTMTPFNKWYNADQTIKIRISAAAIQPNWLASSAVFDIAIVRNRVRLFWNLKPQWRRLEQVTLQGLGLSALDENDANVPMGNLTVNLLAPVGGNFTQPGPAVPVTIQIQPNNWYTGVGPLTGMVQVTKDTPVLELTVRTPVGLGTKVEDSIVSAKITPPLIGAVLDPPKTKVLDTEGDVTLKYTFPGNALFNAAAAPAKTIKVMPKPVIAWTAPGPVVFGTKLDGALLTATTAPAGLEQELVYTPPRDSFLSAIGDVPVTANFPGNPAQPASEPKTVTIKVIKDTPTIEWKNALPVLVNTPLTLKTLSATAKGSHGRPVSLALVFDPASNFVATTVGDLKLKASFPGNANYEAAADQSTTVKVMANAKDLGKEAMLSGKAFAPPSLQRDKDLLKKWETDDSPTGVKAQSRKIMADIQGKTGDELEEYMDDFLAKAIAPSAGTDPPNPLTGGRHLVRGNVIWELSNGLQVRYKPNGDGRPPPKNPPEPMFCVEGKTCVGPSRGDTDVTYKVSSAGEPGAYGPRQTLVPDGVGSQGTQTNTDYIQATIDTTHIKCAAKVVQTITWATPPDIFVGDTLEATLATVAAQDSTALEFFNAANQPVTKDTVLALGDAQKLKVKGKATKRYLASTAFTEVSVNVVKKVQTIVWNPTATELFAGNPVGGDILNATAAQGVTPTYQYSGGAVIPTTILPVGVHEITASAAATATFADATPVKATVTVKLNPQTIVWTPAVTEILAGSKLPPGVFNATAGQGVTPTYQDRNGNPVDGNTVLPVGPNELTALAGDTPIFAAAAPVKATITVTLNPQTIVWAPAVTEIAAGTKLGTGILNAIAGNGVTPAYQDKDKKPVDKDTVLPPGPHELTATAGETAIYAAAAPVKATITVLPKAEDKK